ncbi:MAG: AMP-binding protein [Caldilineaceae bacterium]|nr:AMP-binding protein [Caldilineaceae bacterium]
MLAFNPHETMGRCFERMVATVPTAQALQSQTVGWSYAELNAHANQIAHTLLQQGATSRGQVAIFCESFAWQVAATLAVIKSGNTVVVFDISLPDERLRFMLADAQIERILVDRPLVDRAHLLYQGMDSSPVQLLEVDSVPAHTPDTNLDRAIASTDPLALLYTSGSTGKPKGVIITHQAELHSAWSKHQTLPLGPSPRGAIIASLAYAGPWGMTFRLLSCGGCLCEYAVQRQGVTHFAQWLTAEQITLMVPPIALLRQWCDTLETPIYLGSLRDLDLIGAMVGKADLVQIRTKLLGNYNLNLLYGSTEALNLTAYRVTDLAALPNGTLPVGYPIPHTQLLVLDEAGRPVVPGEAGEVAVQSPYIAPGYWQRPALTQSKFRVDDQQPPLYTYFTGDLGYQTADGCLYITGRKDFMVKIRGYRVETAEVEQALLALAAVQNAAVIAVDATPATTDAQPSLEKALVAYVVIDPKLAWHSIQLRQQLAERLPSYMLPARFVFATALPLTANGKIDRQALPLLNAQNEIVDATYVAPRNDLESTLVAIWCEVLQLESIGVHDPFFHLGGDSLLALQIVARINQQFQIEFSLLHLFETPTVAELARLVQQYQAQPFPFAELPDWVEPSQPALVTSDRASLEKLSPQR